MHTVEAAILEKIEILPGKESRKKMGIINKGKPFLAVVLQIGRPIVVRKRGEYAVSGDPKIITHNASTPIRLLEPLNNGSTVRVTTDTSVYLVY